MTLNPLSSNNTKISYFNNNNGNKNNDKKKKKKKNNIPQETQAEIQPEIQPEIQAEIQAEIQPNENIRPPDQVRVDILFPPVHRNHMNEFVDIMFNDIMNIFQTVQHGNEFNVIQHLNGNNFHPIIK